MISTQEATRWAACRKIVKDGIDTYWEVGKALLEIKESRLYRLEFATFEAYCKTELNVGKSHAYRLIQGAKTLRDDGLDVSPSGGQKYPILPNTERQTRALAKADTGDRSELWGDAVESAGDAPVTAKHVKAAIEAKKPKPKALSKVEQSMADATDAIAPLMAEIQSLRKRVKAMCDSGVSPYCHKQRLDGDLKNAWNGLNHAKPRSKCPGCCGTGRKTCGQCKGIGWVGRDSFNQSPQELKAALREA